MRGVRGEEVRRKVAKAEIRIAGHLNRIANEACDKLNDEVKHSRNIAAQEELARQQEHSKREDADNEVKAVREENEALRQQNEDLLRKFKASEVESKERELNLREHYLTREADVCRERDSFQSNMMHMFLQASFNQHNAVRLVHAGPARRTIQDRADPVSPEDTSARPALSFDPIRDRTSPTRREDSSQTDQHDEDIVWIQGQSGKNVLVIHEGAVGLDVRQNAANQLASLINHKDFRISEAPLPNEFAECVGTNADFGFIAEGTNGHMKGMRAIGVASTAHVRKQVVKAALAVSILFERKKKNQSLHPSTLWSNSFLEILRRAETVGHFQLLL